MLATTEEAVSHPGAVPPDPGGWGSADTLRRDPWVWLLGLTLIGLGVPYLLPDLDSAVVYNFGEFVGLPILLVVAIGAVLFRPRAGEPDLERRFWVLIATGLAVNVVVRLLYALPFTDGTRGHILVDLSYLFFYFALLRAFRLHPDRVVDEGRASLGWVETVTTAVFLSSLLVYFVLVPESVTPGTYSWVPSLLLYGVLDVLLAVTAYRLHQSSASDRWRVTYGLLGFAAAGWAITDVYEALYHLNWVNLFADDSIWNLLWYVPFAVVGFSARVRVTPWPRFLAEIGSRPDPDRPRRTVRVAFVYALALPVLHFVSNLLGVIDPASRDARELTVLIFFPVLLGIAFVHQRFLETRSRTLEEARRALEARQRFLIAAVEQATTAILVVDRSATIVYANPACEEVTGSKAGDLEGGSALEFLEPWGSDAIELMRSGLDAEAGSARIARLLERAPDDSAPAIAREDLVSVLPLLDEDGVVTHVTVSVQDVTRESSLERRLQQSERMEALGTLAGGIAHDFNNVLAAILGYSELLLLDHETGERNKEDIREIVRAAERARGLTAQILTFSRHKDAAQRAINLSAVVTDALKLLRPTIPPSVEVRVDVGPSDCGLVMADEGRLHQVVVNLFANAVHAVGPQGRIEVRVEETSTLPPPGQAHQTTDLVPGEYAVLTIADDGVGIDELTLPRIYDPFFTTKEFGHGTGLGLSVVHGIVSGYGGAIAVESELGVGTTFRVFLPMVETPTAAPEEPIRTVRPSDRSVASVLVVDDEKMVATIVSRSLEHEGFTVTTETDSEAALEQLREAPEQFDLLVTDQTMPKLSGLELASEVQRVRPGMPVLLITGFSDSITPEHMTESGVGEVLYKPLRRHDLVAAVERLLAGIDAHR